MRKTLTLFLVMVMFLVLLVGCSPAKSPDASPKKDSLVWGYLAEPMGLDPQKTQDGNALNTEIAIFDTLLRFDENQATIPNLATEWSISSDGLEYTLKIASGVKFHNGDDLTIDDIIFTYERVKKVGLVPQFGLISKMEAVDPGTLKITINSPLPSFLSCMANPYTAIVNKKLITENEDAAMRNPVGTGPYKFKEWVQGQSITIERNDAYFRGPAPIKTVTFKFITDPSTAIIALEQGQIDVLNTVAIDDRQAILDNQNLKLYEQSGLNLCMVLMNCDSKLLKNVKLRQAIGYAINKQNIIEGAFSGIGDVLINPLFNQSTLYPQNVKGTQYDPEKAKALLAEAGYPNGLSMTMKIMDIEFVSKSAEVIQEQLRQVGIDLKVEKLERVAFLGEFLKGNYDLTFLKISESNVDPDTTLGSYYRKDYIGVVNYVNYRNDEVTTLAIAAQKEQDQAKRAEKYARIAEILAEEVPVVPVLQSKLIYAASKDLKGIHLTGEGMFYTDKLSW